MRTSYIWDQAGLPHKGWACSGVDELEEANFTCEMCGKEEIRFVHNLEHPEGHSVRVGCECAGHLTEQYAQMRDLNQQAQRRAQRRKNLRRLCEEFVKTDWTINSSPSCGEKQVGRIWALWLPAYKHVWKYEFDVYHKGKKIFNGLTMSPETARKAMDKFIGEYNGK